MARPAHRPTKYKPEMCAKVVELMKEGASQAEVALMLGVDRDTVKEWKKEKPEFSAAIKKGIGYSQGWWERKGRMNLDNPHFIPALWFMNMKNRFKDDWRDKHEVEMGGDMTVTIQRFTPENKDGEPWDK